MKKTPPRYTRADAIANALQYINDPARRAALEAELRVLRAAEPVPVFKPDPRWG